MRANWKKIGMGFFIFCGGLGLSSSVTALELEKNPFVENLLKKDPYVTMRLGLFQGHQDELAQQDFSFQMPVVRRGRFGLITTTEFLVPYLESRPLAQGVGPSSIAFHSKARAQWDLRPGFSPFLTAGYAMTKGESLTFSVGGTSVGGGLELVWQSPNSLAAHALLDGGSFIMDDGLIRAYFQSRWEIFLISLKLARSERSPKLNLNLDGKFYYASHTEGKGTLADFGPHLGFVFSNGQEIGFESHWFFIDGYPFRDSTDSRALYLGLRFQAPLVEAYHDDRPSSLNGCCSPSTDFFVTIAGAHWLFMNEAGFHLAVPMLDRSSFRMQMDADFTLSRYFRDGERDISLHAFETGPLFLLIHSPLREREERPYWSLRTNFFVHRSEHSSNPSAAEAVHEGSSPEAISFEIATPYWDKKIWNPHRDSWIDFVSLSLRLNYFILKDIEGDPVRMAGTGLALRPGIALNLLRMGGGLLTLRGEKAIGQEILDWRAEIGWRRPSWELFARGEDLNILPQMGLNRTDYLLGVKFFFPTGS